MGRRIVRTLVRLPQRHDRSPHIGVVANTDGRLPAEALARLADIDLILHAGDIGEASVITRLQAIAPVIAVPGDRDRRSRDPQYRVLQVAGKTIALTHGDSLPGASSLLRLFLAADGEADDRRLLELLRFFPPVDCLVFAHPSTACRIRVQDTLIFNPGALATTREHDYLGSLGILSLGRQVDGFLIQIGQSPSSSPVLAPA